MAWQVFFNNGINVSSGGNILLNGLITDIVNEADLGLDYNVLKTKMDFTDTRASSLDEVFTGVDGPTELSKIVENGLKPEKERTKLPDKGYAIVEYGNKITTSYLMRKRLETSSTLTTADPSVKKEWLKIYDDARYLLEGAMMNITQEMTMLWVEGLNPVSAFNGPGSPTPKGKPLFSLTHPVRDGTLTFANVAPTNIAFSATNLQVAIDILKTGVRNENGYKVQGPRGFYKLYVGMDLAVTARQVLNTAGNQVGVYSGINNNANQLNQFSFMGNLVEIVEIPRLGDVDTNGQAIGTEATWFLTNPRYLQTSKGFKTISLYDPEIKNYLNNDTDGFVIDARLGFAVDHFGAEAGIFGSKGDGTPSNA